MPEPLISLIIPSYNRPRQLANCLQSITRLQYPREQFEVIVVDDGSAVPLDAVVSSARGWLDIILIRQGQAGAAAARNTGAARARGQLLAFLDDDCAPATDWLQTLATRFAATPTHGIGGRTLNALPDNSYSSASQMLVDYLYQYYNVDQHQATFFASNNLALPRAGFHAIGGFNTNFPHVGGEDRELCERWWRHGYRMIYAPEALVYHAHALTLRTFWTQQFHYGRGAFRYRLVCSQVNNDRIALEPLRFYLNLLGFPASQTRGWQALLLSALLLTSQLANGAGFYWERLHHS
jgi:GT2 family glycosyltransferase